jgi:hypothetical protein
MHKGKKFLIISLLTIIIAFIGIPPIQAIDWSPNMRLTWNESDDWHPSITQASDGIIWVVWHSQRTGNYDIFYKTHNASLVHPWSPDTRLTANTSVDRTPSVMATADGKIWIAWSSNRMGNYEIFYTTYDGSSWLPEPKILTTNSSSDDFPSIIQDSDGKIWVFWSSNREGDPSEIFCSTSSDNGANWSTATRLTTHQADDWRPSAVEAADESIWIVWTRDNDLYYKVIFKNMTEKVTDKLLSKSPGQNWHPSVTDLSNGTLWVVWDSDRHDVGRNSDIFYKIYDGSWSSDVRLTQSVENDIMPSITQTSENNIWIVWASTAFDNIDIYYLKDEIPQPHDVAIFSVISSPIVAYRGEEDISIEVVVQNHGTEEEIVDVECRANTTLIGSATFSVAAGQLGVETFVWETSGSPYGICTMSATVAPVPGETNFDDNSNDAKSPVEIRIMGDICSIDNGTVVPFSDRHVNINDFLVAVGQFGAIHPTWNHVWGPLCDVNGDNVVDIDDLMTISLHYGEKA